MFIFTIPIKQWLKIIFYCPNSETENIVYSGEDIGGPPTIVVLGALNPN